MPFPNPATQFKPGNNANPKGRPKTRSVNALIAEALDASAVAVLGKTTDDAGREIPPETSAREYLAGMITSRALGGESPFLQYVLDADKRAEGSGDRDDAAGAVDPDAAAQALKVLNGEPE